jgi:hypothetical protein
MIQAPPRVFGVPPVVVGIGGAVLGGLLLWVQENQRREAAREFHWLWNTSPQDSLNRQPDYGAMTERELKGVKGLMLERDFDYYRDPLTGTTWLKEEVERELRRRNSKTVGDLAFIAPDYQQSEDALWWLAGGIWSAAAAAGAISSQLWGLLNGQRGTRAGGGLEWQGPPLPAGTHPGSVIEGQGTANESLYLKFRNWQDYGSALDHRLMGPANLTYHTWWKEKKYWPAGGGAQKVGYEFHWSYLQGGVWKEGCISTPNDTDPGVGGCSGGFEDNPFDIGDYYIPRTPNPVQVPERPYTPSTPNPPLYPPQPVGPEPATEPKAPPLPAPVPGVPVLPPADPEAPPEVAPAEPGPSRTPKAPPLVAPTPSTTPVAPPETDSIGADGRVVQKPKAPTATTSPDDHFPYPGSKPITGNGPQANPVEMAKELGRIEEKLARIMSPEADTGIEWKNWIWRILEALFEQTQGKTYTLTEKCPPCDGSDYTPATVQVAALPGLSGIGTLSSKVDAIAELLDGQLGLKQQVCPPCKPQQQGDWVTVNFISDAPSPGGEKPLRKRLRYRDLSARAHIDHVHHWEDFTWEAGPVCVISKGMPWGVPQVWASSVEEGKRVISHAAAISGVDLTDKRHEWVISGSSDARYGQPGSMRVQRRNDGWVRVSKRDGSSGLPKLYGPPATP